MNITFQLSSGPGPGSNYKTMLKCWNRCQMQMYLLIPPECM
jgi:hypothetical protein